MSASPSNKRTASTPASGTPEPKRAKPLSHPVHLHNPHLLALESEGTTTDVLYHLGLDSSMDLEGEFGDTRFVLMGGSPVRAKRLAESLSAELGYPVKPFGKTERYSMYKVGPVMSISHGMGMPSMSIALVEITKLLHYAHAQNVAYIRIGTSGGLGVTPGTCIVARSAVSGSIEPFYELAVLGSKRKFPAVFDEELADGILACAGDDIPAVHGITMGTDDFYEGQGRLDGVFCDYTEEDKMNFLRKAHNAGVRNIEMESTCLAAFCLRAGIPAALVCTTLLNRLKGDQVTSSPDQLAQFSANAQNLVIRYVKSVVGVAPAGASNDAIESAPSVAAEQPTESSA